MKKTVLCILSVFFLLTINQYADYLWTIDGKKYEGKMVAFRYNMIHFNIYKFGKYHSEKRFPIYQIWKIKFNNPKEDAFESSYETEQNYKRLRRGKRSRKFALDAKKSWMDTGIKIRIGQEIMFSVNGTIYIHGDQNNKIFHNGEQGLKHDIRKPMPGHPSGALIAKIGKKGKAFYVGSDRAPFRVAQKGNLFIGINDVSFSDNGGQFQVTVYY